MTKSITIAQAKARLSALIDRAAAGEKGRIAALGALMVLAAWQVATAVAADENQGFT